jgi:hypothetical protein
MAISAIGTGWDEPVTREPPKRNRVVAFVAYK